MIELLGVGVPGDGGRWLVRGVCAHIGRGVLTTVVAGSRAQSGALLDALAGRLIPREGRVWVNRTPLMRETAGRVRAAVADVGRATSDAEHGSVLWNILVADGHSLAGLLRFPRRGEREAACRALERVGLGRRARHPMLALTPPERLRVELARALAWRATVVVLRDVDSAVGPDDVTALLDEARAIARAERIVAVASLASHARPCADGDHVLVLDEGRLVFDGHARELTDAQISPRWGAIAP
jgi:ABC-type phosphate/phosphonate transport system ATPase subunit